MTRFENRETQTFARLSGWLSMVGQCAALSSPRLALFISERENCVSTRYVCTFILLPFVAGFNLQRLVSTVYFTVAYDDAASDEGI